MVLRGPADERARLSLLESLSVPTASGRSVPLAQIAHARYGFEEGIIWRRDRLPTMTVRADIVGGLQPPRWPRRSLPTLERDPRRAAAGLPPGNRRHGRGFRAAASVRSWPACRCSCSW